MPVLFGNLSVLPGSSLSKQVRRADDSRQKLFRHLRGELAHGPEASAV
jgi:hypothetical protein